MRLQQPPTGQPPLVIVVEGAIDALAIWQMARTITNLPGTIAIYPVAACGTALTSAQLQLLRGRLPAGTTLAVAFDADPAGRHAYSRVYPLLRDWSAATCAITLPPGTDPADLLTRHGPAAGLTRLVQAMASATRTALVSTLDQLVDDRAVTPGHWPTASATTRTPPKPPTSPPPPPRTSPPAPPPPPASPPPPWPG